VNLVYVGRVMRDYLRFVVVGVVLCVLAAIFVYARPGWDGGPTLTPRTPQVWKASSTLQLTQEGFPAGRAVDDATGANSDPSRLSSLAVLYSELAVGDRVRTLAESRGKIQGDITAEPVIYNIGQFSTPVLLPMVRISVTAPTAPEALQGSTQVANALQRYVTSGQAAAKIPPRARVVIQTARSGRLRGSEPLLVSGPSKAVPVVAFALLAGLLLMTVFALDNYRTNADEDSAGERSPQDAVSGDSRRSQRPASASGVSQGEGARGTTARRPRAVPSPDPPRTDGHTADLPAADQTRSRWVKSQEGR
jgi:hypothetical protein